MSKPDGRERRSLAWACHLPPRITHSANNGCVRCTLNNTAAIAPDLYGVLRQGERQVGAFTSHRRTEGANDREGVSIYDVRTEGGEGDQGMPQICGQQ